MRKNTKGNYLKTFISNTFLNLYEEKKYAEIGFGAHIYLDFFSKDKEGLLFENENFTLFFSNDTLWVKIPEKIIEEKIPEILELNDAFSVYFDIYSIYFTELESLIKKSKKINFDFKKSFEKNGLKLEFALIGESSTQPETPHFDSHHLSFRLTDEEIFENAQYFLREYWLEFPPFLNDEFSELYIQEAKVFYPRFIKKAESSIEDCTRRVVNDFNDYLIDLCVNESLSTFEEMKEFFDD